MNTSFELLSSMSPKVNKNRKPINKGPTILALKKYFRKSLAFDNAENSAKDESIITVESSTTGTDFSSEANQPLNDTPIVISDSETSVIEYKTPSKKSPNVLSQYLMTPHTQEPHLCNEKYKNIQHWVEDVNSAKQDVSVFTEVSAILQNDTGCFKQPKINVAASSTLLESDLKRFDQCFKKNTPIDSSSSQYSCESNKKSICNENVIINDSLITDDLDVGNDLKNTSGNESWDLDFNESLNTRNKRKQFNKNCKPLQTSDEDLTLARTEEYEDLLDDLYGNSWRDKKDDILPSSEPRLKTSKNIVKKAPNTERHANKICDVKKNSFNSNLLSTLQKARFKRALESPWVASLRRVCDSDTESEEEKGDHVMSRVKLNFEDEDSDREDKYEEKTKFKTNMTTETSRKLTTKSTKEQYLKSKSTNNKNYSFLASLSGNISIEKCHLTALIFRQKFQQHKEALASKLFNLYNEKVFDHLLPKDTVIEWSDRLRGTAGMCSCKKITRRTGAIERTAKIVLSTKVLDSADRVRDTLIHELCHAATWIVNEVSDGHGPFWKSWASRAMKTFPELPPISRCHNYVINTKYTYKCTGCGYSVGRHTKSLNTDRKRCGYCFGTFEVLINKTTKQGETKSVPATPKKPTGFALFVKENYATLKKPDLTHGDVMKILGQRFADMKINKT